ncbi:MAG: FAD-dependent oxidoreductase [Pseudomonadota bacterium]
MDKPDLLVVGGGVFGLSVALEGLRAGLTTVIADQTQPGMGASATPVGALTPHMPEGWGPLKAFQFESLCALPDAAARLASEAGAAPFYSQTGRLTPLTTPAARARAERQIAAAEEIWQGRARVEVLDRAPKEAEAVIAPGACLHGLMHDTLSARLHPRRYLAALRQRVAAGAEVLTGWTAQSLGEDGREVICDRGRLAASHIVLAAGWQTGALAPVGFEGGVKGQAAMLSADLPVDLPVLQAPGLFIVRHGPGEVAVGSTSERVWTHLDVDAQLDNVIEKAHAFCPPLAGAQVIARWAGVRPKGPRPEPVIGPLPGRPGIWIASGGYKIGLGIAHHAARALIGAITENAKEPALPEIFLPRAAG